LSIFIEKIQDLIDYDPEIWNCKKLSDNGYKLFKKTRTSASTASLRKVKDFNITSIHPLLKTIVSKHDVTNYTNETNVLNKISSYKPP